MNRYIVLFPVALLILSGTGIVSQAFAATTMTMETDRHVYDHASTIILTGHVEPVDLRGSEVTILCKSPGGTGVCGIYQLGVNSDGNFSLSINTSTFLMKNDGTYQFQAQYSSLADATVSVELVDAVETSESSETGTDIGTAITGQIETETGESVLYKLGAGQIEYDMTCDADPAFFANSDDDSIIVYLDPTSDGIITLTLHAVSYTHLRAHET